jgi:nucleoside-diphosphate-sugar epimerase
VGAHAALIPPRPAAVRAYQININIILQLLHVCERELSERAISFSARSLCVGTAATHNWIPTDNTLLAAASLLVPQPPLRGASRGAFEKGTGWLAAWKEGWLVARHA